MFLAVVISASANVSAQDGGIQLLAGETLFAEGFRTSMSHIYERDDRLYRGSSRIGDPTDRQFEKHRAVFGLDYGLLPELTLSALVPTVHIEQRVRGAGGSQFLRATGLGDIALLGKYRVWKRDWPLSTFNLALIGGLETPTGDTRARDGGMRLGPTLQPGSGSWDPIAAVAATLSINRVRFDASILGKVNTEGSRDYADGDFFGARAVIKYRFLHMQYPGPTAGLSAGVTYRHEGRDEIDGRGVRNTGFDEILIGCGLTCHPSPGWDVSISVQAPFYRDVRGTQLSEGLRTFVAVGIRF